MILTVTHANYDLLEPDVYRVKLVDVQEVRGAYGEQVRLKLEVVDPDYAGVTLTAWANLSSAPQSKLVRWLGAFHGNGFGAGERIDVDRLIGKTAKAVVDVKSSADGRTYNRVNDILPLRQKADDPFLEDE